MLLNFTIPFTASVIWFFEIVEKALETLLPFTLSVTT